VRDGFPDHRQPILRWKNRASQCQANLSVDAPR
jgi:hypothetical protein